VHRVNFLLLPRHEQEALLNAFQFQQNAQDEQKRIENETSINIELEPFKVSQVEQEISRVQGNEHSFIRTVDEETGEITEYYNAPRTVSQMPRLSENAKFTIDD